MGAVVSRASPSARGSLTYQAGQQLQEVERVALRLERMHADPDCQPYRDAAVGSAVPYLPTRASLAGAVATLDQVARVLRHQAGDEDGKYSQ